ncbi:MAG: hypothetical protein LDL44_07065 [Caenispirillum sp.]|nr:hypothetical protein [Caenispirillum sp.]
MNRWTAFIRPTRLLTRLARRIYLWSRTLEDVVRMLDWEARHPEQGRGSFSSWWRFYRGTE